MTISIQSPEELQEFIGKVNNVYKEDYQSRAFTVAMVDQKGDLSFFYRFGSPKLLTIELTQRKAYTSSRMGVATKDFLSRLQNEKLEISYFADEKFTALPGGLPVFDTNGQCIGGVAVGGLSAQEDHEAAETLCALLKS